MASTLIKKGNYLSNLHARLIVLDVTSYPTGGESITNAILGIEGTAKPFIFATPIETSDVIFRHDRTNNKLIATVASTGAQVANLTDVGEIELLVVQGL